MAARNFHRLRRPLRVLATMPSPAMPGWIAPPGVSRPFSDFVRRDPYHPGLPHPARSALGVSRPLDGLLSLRTCGLAGPAAAPGVPISQILSSGKAGTHRCVRCALSSAVRASLRTLRNTRPSAPWTPRHLSPSALVPWPWSQNLEIPLRSTSSSDRRAGFHPARPLTRFRPRRLGEP